jgi:hypothetical protein
MWIINFLPTIWQFIIQAFFQGLLLKLGKPWVQPVRSTRVMTATFKEGECLLAIKNRVPMKLVKLIKMCLKQNA